MFTSPSRVIALLLVVVLSSLIGVHQPAPTTQPNEDGLLRGPTVPDTVSRTLIRTDLQGRFLPIEGRPEEAALPMVVSDPERRQLAQDAMRQRMRTLGMLLVDNIDAVREATDARRAGDNELVTATYQRMYEMLDPTPSRAPLMPAFTEVLTADERTEVARLVDEYWDAWIAWAGRAGNATVAETERQLQFRLFQRELGVAYNWSLRPTRERLERLYSITEATEDQRHALRDVMIDHIRTTRLEPDEDARRATADRIYELLDDGQRRRLFTHALWTTG